jgi:hypothetical protein
MKHFFIGSCLLTVVASATVAQAGTTLDLI